MNLSASYARALHELVAKNPSKGSDYIKNLRHALARRGHEKLLPRIFSDYHTLTVKEERLRVHQAITPQKEQTRILLELYRKLTQGHE